MIKRDSRSEYGACLCNVWVSTELVRLLAAVKLELLPDKGASDRKFQLIFRCTLCTVHMYTCIILCHIEV